MRFNVRTDQLETTQQQQELDIIYYHLQSKKDIEAGMRGANQQQKTFEHGDRMIRQGDWIQANYRKSRMLLWMLLMGGYEVAIL
jgi:hypothetical protein